MFHKRRCLRDEIPGAPRGTADVLGALLFPPKIWLITPFRVATNATRLGRVPVWLASIEIAGCYRARPVSTLFFSFSFFFSLSKQT